MELFIYKLTHKPTGKIYIGQTRNPEFRLSMHKFSLEQGTHFNKALQADFDTKGGDLEIEILETLPFSDRSLASDREFEWMKKCKSYETAIGYNGKDPRIRNTKTGEYTRKMKKHLGI